MVSEPLLGDPELFKLAFPAEQAPDRHATVLEGRVRSCPARGGRAPRACVGGRQRRATRGTGGSRRRGV